MAAAKSLWRLWRWLLVASVLVGLTTGQRFTRTSTPTPTPTPTPTAAPATTVPATTAPPATLATSSGSSSYDAVTTSSSSSGSSSASAAPTEAAKINTTTSSSDSSVDTAVVCTADQLAVLADLSENNPYLRSKCGEEGGASGYVFPVNGVLSYAQLTAMSKSSACQVYFQAVLKEQSAECEVAEVSVLATAQAVLTLAARGAPYPTEAQLTAAIAARAAEYASSSGSTSLDWSLLPASELQSKTEVILTSDLVIVGVAYSGSDTGVDAGSGKDDSLLASASQSGSGGSNSAAARWRASSLAMTVIVASFGVLYC